MSPPPARFRDPLSTEYDFIDVILVRCPRCARIARVQAQPTAEAPPHTRLFTPRRLVCRTCGLSRTWQGGWAALSGGSRAPDHDPYFRLPLWLQVETRHGVLSAYNLRQLDLLGKFVAAPLRERAPWYGTGPRMTYVARLPAWVKSAKNREEVLRAVDRMRACVVSAG
ncbi:hypothetical protein [Streptomyces resistomycificus]|uniref:Uncharacterized protein n=1 Tax=Streptomyces resistomycificus TaxID=67356 RepID=A0A0L8KU84_9ACTN|nr:hypothetical protein [Streptomyces resistomycificus]KOG29425.1 hypothetical protein ADK37_37500 [Streptomyces resistomycificus]KUO01891.1 hypothetical protein AQJ84_04710 [Streptomyces resistomycificus]